MQPLTLLTLRACARREQMEFLRQLAADSDIDVLRVTNTQVCRALRLRVFRDFPPGRPERSCMAVLLGGGMR